MTEADTLDRLISILREFDVVAAAAKRHAQIITNFGLILRHEDGVHRDVGLPGSIHDCMTCQTISPNLALNRPRHARLC